MEQMRIVSIALVLTVVATLIFGNLPTVAAQGDITVGGRVEVIFSPSFDRVNLRSGAGLDYAIIRELREGETGTVVDGPRQADGYTWWKVSWDEGNTGWAADGDAQRIWIAPLPIPTPSSGTLQDSCSIKLLDLWSWDEPDLAAFEAVANNTAEQVLEAIFVTLEEASDSDKSLPSRLTVRDMWDQRAHQYVTDVSWAADGDEMVIQTRSLRPIRFCEALESLD